MGNSGHHNRQFDINVFLYYRYVIFAAFIILFIYDIIKAILQVKMTHLIHKEYYSGKYRDREQKSERGEAFSDGGDFRGYFSGKNMSNLHNDYGTGSEPVKMKTEAINSAFQASQHGSSGHEQYM